MNALVTGLGDAARRGQLLPLGPRSEAWGLAHRLVEEPGPLVAHPPAALRRRVVRATLAGLVVTVVGLLATALAGWWWVLAVGLALLALGLPLGLGRYAALGHVSGPRSFSVRSGWLVREQAVLQRRAVVGWQVHQTFFQRRAGLATVVACVGAGRGRLRGDRHGRRRRRRLHRRGVGGLGRDLPSLTRLFLSVVGATVRHRMRGSRHGRRHQPLGTPTWIDLGVPDLDRALEFYGAVFGWDFDIGPEEYGRYTICLLRGRRGGRPLAAARGRRTGASWNVYLATPDCDGRPRRRGRPAGCS